MRERVRGIRSVRVAQAFDLSGISNPTGRVRAGSCKNAQG